MEGRVVGVKRPDLYYYILLRISLTVVVTLLIGIKPLASIALNVLALHFVMMVDIVENVVVHGIHNICGCCSVELGFLLLCLSFFILQVANARGIETWLRFSFPIRIRPIRYLVIMVGVSRGRCHLRLHIASFMRRFPCRMILFRVQLFLLDSQRLPWGFLHLLLSNCFLESFSGACVCFHFWTT